MRKILILICLFITQSACAAPVSDNSANEEAKKQCAQLSYETMCGFSNSGKNVFVVNKRSDASIKVTVHTNWKKGIDKGEYDRVHNLAAGLKKRIGCTVGNGVSGAIYSFKVVGCEVK
ncbi:hypothetical protein LRP50_25205 [Enterovibrio sp. ZSDZ42]|uniref:Uncharacterized protein n=1 Tax=Enterovibrio gelatinilyticus TaxID=2899819 RepID=A0ABT5R818_9GAMM|nr:hypothetical protein [Enterovibrio sp. ZSDZ42]MDD1796418.1 hypothetical protein [Enterovibrio sp. ZSDZ42]